jgi:putative hemolysin
MLGEHDASNSRSPTALDVIWANTAQEVAQAQHLRWRVFVEEHGARVQSPVPGLDVDRFDAHCQHLLVRDRRTKQVIGTCRVLTGRAAARIGSFYSDQEFDLCALDHMRHRMVEIGRSCVHPGYRNGAIVALLWSGLAQLLLQGEYDTLIGCASIPVQDGGHEAASIYAKALRDGLSSQEYRVVPRLPLPLHTLDATRPAEPPPLIKAYFRCGARVCGAPHWDRDFNTADLFVMLEVGRLEARYARHFLKPVALSP